MPPSPDIHELAARFGTDKGICAVPSALAPKGYTWTYGWLLEGFRDRPLKLLEIGVRRGASLAMWAAYLPRAEIVGIDVDPESWDFVVKRGIRAFVVVGNQADPAVLEAALAILGGSVDVVIDDGSHRGDDQRASLAHLWPHVRGWYAVEEPASTRWLLDLGAEFHAGGKLAIVRRRP